MVAPPGMERIQDGYAYKNGQPKQLYAWGDGGAARAILLKKCVDYSIGPLTIHACVDTTGPSASFDVSLFGASLGDCELSLQHQDCRVGGSIAGFKAEIDATLKEQPLELTVDGKFCTPFADCESFSYTLSL